MFFFAGESPSQALLLLREICISDRLQVPQYLDNGEVFRSMSLLFRNKILRKI